MNTKLISTFILLLPVLISCTGKQGEKNHVRPFVINNTDWKDMDGNPIRAHDGGISRFNGTWYWYGTEYSKTPKGEYGAKVAGLNPGIKVYTSKDLASWKFEGIALAYPDTGWGSQGTIGRAHVMFNEMNRQYVMWFFHFVDKFPDRIASVAVSDHPEGPFRISGGARITGAPETIDRRPDGIEVIVPAGCSGDLNVFKDDDGKAYFLYDDGRRNIRVDLLTDDYLYSTGKTVIALDNLQNIGSGSRQEAPAMIRYKGQYLVAGSGVHGWSGTPTSYAVADNPMGPYSLKKALTPNTRLNTWNSQITSFVYIPETDLLFAMCDQWWIPDINDLNKSRYLWLEVVYREGLNEFEMVYSDTLFFDKE